MNHTSSGVEMSQTLSSFEGYGWGLELGVRGSENGGREEEKMGVISAGKRSSKLRGRKRDFWGLEA